jgi:hypothetical protein
MRLSFLLAALLASAAALPALGQSSASGQVGSSTTVPQAVETPPPAEETQNTTPPGTEDKANPLAPLLKGLLKPRTENPEAAETPPVEEETPPATVEETPPATVEETPPATEETPDVAEPPAAETDPDVAEARPDDGRRIRPNHTWMSPKLMRRIIQDHVDEVRVDDSGGDTTLEGKIDGHAFQVYFYRCDGGDMASVAKPDSECLGYEFRAYFPGYPTDVERVNQWNADHHYGKLWVDSDGDLAVQMQEIVEGGIKTDNVLQVLDWFKVVVSGVREFYGY